MTLSNCRSVALCEDFRHMQKSYSFSYTTKTCVFGLTNIISQQTFLFGDDIHFIEFPASVIRQVSVHGVDFPGKQHGFFPSNSTVYLHNDLVVLGDRRQHKFYHLWICAASRIYILSSSKTFNQSGICLMTICQLAEFFLTFSWIQYVSCTISIGSFHLGIMIVITIRNPWLVSWGQSV